MMIKKQFSSNIIHLGILQDCAWTWKQLWWKDSAGNVSWWNSTISIRRASRIHESWHETIDGRSRFKLKAFTHKTETNQVDQFLLCQVFLCFGSCPSAGTVAFPKARSATWSTLRTQTRRLVRRVSRRRVGGWCFSSNIAHNTTLFPHFVYFMKDSLKRTGMLEQFTEHVHHLHFHREVTSFSRKTSKCGLQVHVHTSQHIPTRDSKNQRYMFCSP